MSDPSPSRTAACRRLHAGLWIALALGLVLGAFRSLDSPTYLAAAATAAYCAVGAGAGRLLYFILFAPLIFFGAMLLSMFLILSFGR